MLTRTIMVPDRGVDRLKEEAYLNENAQTSLQAI